MKLVVEELQPRSSTDHNLVVLLQCPDVPEFAEVPKDLDQSSDVMNSVENPNVLDDDPTGGQNERNETQDSKDKVDS
jgi:hypothetical protein